MSTVYLKMTKRIIAVSLCTYVLSIVSIGPAWADGNSSQTPEPNQANKPLRPTHDHVAFSQRREERNKMVDKQIQRRGVDDPNVLRALRTVPRHAFVRAADQYRAYDDQPLPIGLGQTISQPYIVGYMTDALKLKSDDKILEVGTGSGYQAAVCAEIAGEVYTIEIIDELAKSAAKRMEELGYRNVQVKSADGYFGWAEHGPFDAVIITCATGIVPPPLLEQLKPGGKMILPKGSPYGAQTLVLINKNERGEIRSKHLLPVRFVPMLGEVRKSERQGEK